MDFYYSTPQGRQSMRWRRTKRWNRSFMGRENATQPVRGVYLRTLSNLANPSEVRGILSMSRLDSPPSEERLTASQVAFAQRMLPFRYDEVVRVVSRDKNLLFATQEQGVSYSELHMAAGERAILRLSQEIAQLEDALVLIDEVEAGLHPRIQHLLMLELQQLALRNDLQIIVTSHSPVVLDSVPMHARIFLERTDTGQVRVVREPYRDVVQDALYGRSHDVLNVLCEDRTGAGVVHGILDVLVPKEGIRRESIRVGSNTGAGEFPVHAKAFRRFGQLHNFVFVLDGDQEDSDIQDRIWTEARREVPVLYLPGRDNPETWTWNRLRDTHRHASELGTSPQGLGKRTASLDAVYDSASDKPSRIVKYKLSDLAEELRWSVPDICRIVARSETHRKESDIQPLAERLRDAIQEWRPR